MIGDLRRCPGRIRTLTGGTRIRSATITPPDKFVLRVQNCEFILGRPLRTLNFFIRFNLFLHIYPFNGNADSMTAYDFFMRSSISCPLFSWG